MTDREPTRYCFPGPCICSTDAGGPGCRLCDYAARLPKGGLADPPAPDTRGGWPTANAVGSDGNTGRRAAPGGSRPGRPRKNARGWD